MTPGVLRGRCGPAWDELERLLKRRKGGRAAGADALRLGRLYREASGHLAAARAYFPEDELTRYLNGLVARAHMRLYGRGRGEWSDVGAFLARGFPDAVRAVLPFFAAAWGVTAAAGLIGFLSVLADPGSIYALLPADFVRQFDPNRTGARMAPSPLIASLIMTHNIQVTIIAFLGAFTCGVLTLAILYQNGLILGALAALFLRAGHSLSFWSLILPHGCIELTAIAVAGAAGLSIGYRVLVPGDRPRLESLRRAALLGGRLLAGAALLLVAAGTIEGLLTPSAAPVWVKYAFAGATVVLLAVYLGRGRAERAAVEA